MPPGQDVPLEGELAVLSVGSSADAPGAPRIDAVSVIAPVIAASRTVLRRQSKVFCQSAALTWEIAALADQASSAHPLCTVMIEAAAGDGTGRSVFPSFPLIWSEWRSLPAP